MRYLVAYFDTNGVGRLAGTPNDFNDEPDALLRIQEILAQQQKEHKVDYRAIPYPSGKKEETMQEQKIAG